MKYVYWLSDTRPSTQKLHYLILRLQIPHTWGTFGGHEAALALLLPCSLGTRCLSTLAQEQSALFPYSWGTRCPLYYSTCQNSFHGITRKTIWCPSLSSVCRNSALGLGRQFRQARRPQRPHKNLGVRMRTWVPATERGSQGLLVGQPG